MKFNKILLLSLSMFMTVHAFAQDDLDDLLKDSKVENEKVFAKNAFKSTRVINGQSMEMLGKGVLDFRILHRFGMIKGGLQELFGLDQASMRMGFDYGISKDLGIGIGRSTLNKELDGFVKYRIAHQHTGYKAFPISILWVSGMTFSTAKITDTKLNTLAYRTAYFHQAILGRKFSESFSLQLAPSYVHKNLVDTRSDKNDILALGIGSRLKISNRTAIVVDAHPILYGANKNTQYLPLSIGVDIETGGHVFQLHVSNSRGMNEKAFIAETNQNWSKGEINFGFNLSRVFTVVKNKDTSW
ncbi:MAG: DUF5777 family beta-barrel protein [Chitinophagaceae bacterium]